MKKTLPKIVIKKATLYQKRGDKIYRIPMRVERVTEYVTGTRELALDSLESFEDALTSKRGYRWGHILSHACETLHDFLILALQGETGERVIENSKGKYKKYNKKTWVQAYHDRSYLEREGLLLEEFRTLATIKLINLAAEDNNIRITDDQKSSAEFLVKKCRNPSIHPIPKTNWSEEPEKLLNTCKVCLGFIKYLGQECKEIIWSYKGESPFQELRYKSRLSKSYEIIENEFSLIEESLKEQI